MGASCVSEYTQAGEREPKDQIEKLLRDVAERERSTGADQTASLRAELFESLADERRERNGRLNAAFAAED